MNPIDKRLTARTLPLMSGSFSLLSGTQLPEGSEQGQTSKDARQCRHEPQDRIDEDIRSNRDSEATRTGGQKDGDRDSHKECDRIGTPEIKTGLPLAKSLRVGVSLIRSKSLSLWHGHFVPPGAKGNDRL